jgi:hypothetical protein
LGAVQHPGDESFVLALRAFAGLSPGVAAHRMSWPRRGDRLC